jgi:hypothetical protein
VAYFGRFGSWMNRHQDHEFVILSVKLRQNVKILRFYSWIYINEDQHRKTGNDRRLGTEGYFTYCKNSMGPIMKNITSCNGV